MKIVKNISIAFIISLTLGLLSYYEIFIPHSPTGNPLLIKNKSELTVFVTILSTLIFLILNGNVQLYKKKEEEELKLKGFRKDKK